MINRANQRGFAALEAILIILLLAAIGVAGYFAYKAHQNQPAAVSSPAVTRSSTPTTTDPTASWMPYSSTAGKFSARYPTSWVQPTGRDLCTAGLFDRALYLGPNAQSVLACGSSNFGQMSVSSADGDQTATDALTTGYVDVATTSVTVAGVAGKRTAATASGQEGPGSYVDGTKVIEYIFYTNGTTYVAHYVQAPTGATSQDVSIDFDLMVTKTLRFSS